ncbi:AAA family ATPase [Coraliomargarita parva]|uniref:AAA family ATPase n=1 Tax=Coraliomargarita parva TaxID=3014050 RepID=UPI0022B51436|nr:MoxR family ATPase [Coraliomargarita parva]
MPDLSLETATQTYKRLREAFAPVIVGQDAIIELLLVSLFSKGHCLLIGVPGLAKTLLAKSVADALAVEFKRIQFTPDLMPADILGSELIQEDENRHLRFEHQKGPIFTNLLLADEINRTPPKTQSALLEAMQERRVTLAGVSHPLPDPFLVIATQNPIEQEGTYPLPEAQLDRFMFSLYIEYPELEDEKEIVRRTTCGQFQSVASVASREEIVAIQELAAAMPVGEHVLAYAVELAASTRASSPNAPQLSKDYIEWGAGPRASQYLIIGAKTRALLQGRAAPETEDVRAVAHAVLQHRIVPNYRATGEGLSARKLITHLVEAVKEPTYA